MKQLQRLNGALAGRGARSETGSPTKAQTDKQKAGGGVEETHW